MKKGEWGLLIVLFVFIVTLTFLSIPASQTPSGLQVADVQELQSASEEGRGTLESRTTQATCADCSGCSGCASTPGELCILTADISNNAECIVVTANGVTIDCNGNEIAFASDTDSVAGIDASGVQNTRVQNCIVNQTNTAFTSSSGVLLSSNSGSTVHNTTFTSGDAAAISIQSGSSINVTNNTFYAGAGNSIAVTGAQIHIQGNRFNSTTGSGVSTTGSLAVVIHNNSFATASGGFGISLQTSRESAITNNTFNTVGIVTAIFTSGANDTNISNNNVVRGGIGPSGRNFSITNNILRPGTSGDAYVIVGQTNYFSFNNTIFGNSRFENTIGNSTSTNDSFNGRVTIRGVNLSFVNSTFNGSTTGALWLALTSSRITVANATVRASTTAPAMSINGTNHTLINIRATTQTAPILRLNATQNTLFSNVSMETNGSWINATATSNISFLNTTFNDTNGSIYFSEFNLSSDAIINQSHFNISENLTFVNSTNFSFFNTTAQITLRGLTFTDPEPLIDVEDDGTFVACNPPDCVEDSYAGGVLVLNVTHFTTHATRETVSTCSFLIFSANANITTNQTCDNIIVNSGVILTINNTAANNTSIGFFAVNFTLHTGAVLNATSTGFSAGQGAGAGTGQAGAGHGGRGGPLSGTPGTFYGSSLAPLTLGSGASNSRGGGAIYIQATRAELNGTIVSDGTNGGFDSGGGAGGSIFVNATTVFGSGSYLALGGRGATGGGSGSGGGGGRIAVHADNLSALAASQFNVSAGTGTSNANNGTAGTAVWFDRDDLDLFAVNSFRFQGNDFGLSINNLRTVTFLGAATEINTSILFNVTNWTMENTSNLTGLSLENITLSINASDRVVLNNISVSILNVSASTIDILSTANIEGHARGFFSGQGSGASTGQAGAGHGGRGGSLSGTPGTFYGSSLAPITLGSGSNNGRGGGRVIMNATTFNHNGTIQMDGGPGGFDGGGGGGGSIFINASTVSGNGSYFARGGRGGVGGGSGSGGGGGRIAVHADNLSALAASQFNVSAGTGTSNANNGTAGTAVWFDRDDLDLFPVNDFRFQDNDFSSPTNLRNVRFLGAATEINASILFNVTNWTMMNTSNLTGLSLENITLSINSSDRVVLNNVSVSIFNVSASTIDVLSTATINGQARGFAAGQGPGNATAQAGAAHGGNGGTLSGTPGTFYGSSLMPLAFGSGGGGSRGGGRVVLISTTLTNNGTIQVDGGTGGFDSGGGGGGSIFINASTVSGNGSYFARGGSGATPAGGGGGGGGGRIAVHADDVSQLSALQFNVTGGTGTAGGVVGNPGTSVLFDRNDLDLLPVNNFRFQTNDFSSTANNLRSVRFMGASTEVNGSIAFNVTNWTMANSSNLTGLTLQGINLTINASDRIILNNVSVSVLNLSASAIDVLSTATVSGKARGLAAGQGPGNATAQAGAGHGGSGGALSGTPGTFYGSSILPILMGSGGSGSRGGGIIVANATTFTNNGTVQTDGGDGGFDSGGGGGGSIFINASTVSGNGSYFARGGSGATPSGSGGGGGGGRIAVYGTDVSSLTATQFNVTGGIGTGGGATGGTGTAGIFDRDDNNLLVVQGWRWQGNDEPFSFTNVTVARGAAVLSNGSSVNISDTYTGDNSTLTVQTGTLTLNSTRFISRNTTFSSTGTTRLSIGYRTFFDDVNSTYSSGTRLNLRNISVSEVNWSSFTALVGNLSTHTSLRDNFVRANSTAQPGLNVSANITLYGISVPDPFPIFDDEDDGTFSTCSSPRCTELFYDGSTFIFNVSRFTTYSTAGGVNFSKSDSLDPVTAGSTLLYTILINNTNGNITNVTVVETYPPQVLFNGSQPTPTTGNNTFVIGNLSENATFQINITVNVSSGLANLTIINNTANLTFLNLSNTSFNATVTENTTVFAFVDNFTPACPYLINVSTIMDQDISCPTNTFIFNADNVALDCAGFTVNFSTGGGSSNSGVSATNKRNLTIRNCNIQDTAAGGSTGVGINFTNTTNSTIENNTVQTNGTSFNFAIRLTQASDGNIIQNNTLRTRGTSFSNYAVYMLTGVNNTIIRHNYISPLSTASTGSVGVKGETTIFNTTVYNNTIITQGTSSNYGVAFDLGNTGNNTINNNNITTNGSGANNVGIRLVINVNDNTAANNTINTNGTDTNYGITLSATTNCKNNNFINNTINARGTTTSNEGIRVVGACTNTLVQYNNITTYGAGTGNNGITSFSEYANSTIRDNTIRTSGSADQNRGIQLTGARNFTIINNSITTNGTSSNSGILLLSGSNDSLVQNNSISTNGTADTNVGISVNTNGRNNTITQNVVRTSGTSNNYGVELTTSSQNNTITDNDVQSSGAGSSNYGVYVTSNSGNALVRGNTVRTLGTGSNFGILLSNGVNNSRVENNSVTTNGTSTNNVGIAANTDGNNNTVAYNIVTTNGTSSNFGIEFTTRITNSVIHSNTVRTNGTSDNRGINVISQSHNAIVNNNTVFTSGSAGSNYGIGQSDSNNVTTYNNTVYTSGTNDNEVMFVQRSNDSRVYNNTLTSSGTAGDNIGLWILDNAHRNNATNNTISTNGSNANHGIRVSNSANSTLVEHNNIRTEGNSTTGFAVGIYLSSSPINTTVQHNSLSTNGGPFNWGIGLDTAYSTLVYNNTITTNGTSQNMGIRLDFGAENNTVRNNTVTTDGTSNSNFGIAVSRSYNSTVANNTVRTYSSTSHALRVASFSNNTYVDNNDLSTSGANSYGLAIGTTEGGGGGGGGGADRNRFNNTRLANVTEWITIIGSNQTQFTNTTFETANGSINFPSNFSLNGTNNITKAKLNILLNLSTLNSTNITELNTSATIRLNSINFTNPRPLIDLEDDGTFDLCNPPDCAEDSYAGGIFVFNVTHFTGHAAMETQSVSCPLNVTVDTSLTENLTCPATAVNILSDNLTFDCNGFNISYANNETGFGINASSRRNITVRNCNVVQGNTSFNGAHAIEYANVNNSLIANTTANATGGATSVGIRLFPNSNNNTIENSTTASTSAAALRIQTSANNTVNNVTAIGGNGMVLQSLVGALVNNSIATGQTELTLCSNVTMLNSNISGLSGIGLFINQCFNSHIQNVTATGSMPAIQVQNSANNTLISVNGTSGTSDGIRLSIGRNITLANSTGVTNLFSFGITTQLLNDSVLTGNTGRSTSSGFGISLSLNSRNITLHNNTASVSAVTSNSALLISSSHNSTITNNSVSGGLNAILSTSSTGNYFANNTMANPSFSALHLYLSLNGTVIEDNFIPNGTHSLVINETDGVIAYVQTVNFTSAANLSQIINVTLNNTFVNSTNTSALNRTAQITLFGIAFTDPRPVFDFDDDGIFSPCDPPQCVEDSFTGGTLVFNVTGFTAYASDETPLAVVNITFDKSDSQDPVPAGGLLNYTIEINVSGDTLAQNVTVVESYPAGVTFVSSSPAATGANDTFSLGNLTNGTNFVINITVNVSSSIGNGTLLNNSVNLSFLNSTNGTVSAVDSELTTVLGFPQISITKADSPDPVNNGSTLTYTITVTNTGDDYAFNVTVLDTFPANVTFNGSSIVALSGNDTYLLDNLSPNQTVNFTTTVNVSGAMTSGTLTNNVTVNFTNSTGQLAQATAFQITTVTTPSVPAPAPSAGGGGGGTNLARNAQINRTLPPILQPVFQRAAAPVQSAPQKETTPPAQVYEPVPILEPIPEPKLEPQPIMLPETRGETSLWPTIALIILALFVLFVMTRVHAKQPPVRPHTQKISTQKLDADIRELKKQLEQTKKILHHKIK